MRAENLTRGLRLRLVAIWLVAAVSALAPWLLKNALFVANPVYPFLGNLFSNGLSVDAAAWTAAARGEFWHGGAFSWRTWLLLPWELFARARDLPSFVGPALIAFAPLALFWRKAAFPFGIATALFAIQYALWASSTAMSRFLIPALPLFCLFAAQQLTRLAKERRPWAPWLAVGVIAWNLSWNAAALDAMGAPGAVFGYETPSSYRQRPQRGYPHPYADAAVWIAENLPDGAKILLCGESRSYPIPHTVTTASAFDPDPLLSRLRGAAGPQDLFAKLKALGVTHLLIGHGEASRARAKALGNLTAEELRLLSFFLQAYANPLFQNDFGVVVYELRPPAGPVFPVSDPDQLPALVRLAIAHGARF
jgi:hypothetical protein